MKPPERQGSDEDGEATPQERRPIITYQAMADTAGVCDSMDENNVFHPTVEKVDDTANESEGDEGWKRLSDKDARDHLLKFLK